MHGIICYGESHLLVEHGLAIAAFVVLYTVMCLVGMGNNQNEQLLLRMQKYCY